MIVWSGIFGYLVSLHIKISRLKNKIEEKKSEAGTKSS
jgi:CcmD family protein